MRTNSQENSTDDSDKAMKTWFCQQAWETEWDGGHQMAYLTM